MSNSAANGAQLTRSDAFVAINDLSPKHRIYPRIQELRQFFIEQFGTEPDFFVRVPGRVNLIGEHVDYCGYPVLPMAVDQCIVLAVGRTQEDRQLHLRNIERTKFKDFNCDLENVSDELAKTDGPQWYKYYLCGVRGIHEELGSKRQPIGIKVALSGNIPPASGLSSSSALVSASALATAHAHGMPLDRKQLASISASSECYIGTHSGGMDQAIAYLAKLGCAQFIEFHPKLNATPIVLPPSSCFVVANSLAASYKAASSNYNERVVECRLGSRILAKASNLPNWRNTLRFVALQDELGCDLEQLEQLAKKYLSQSNYNRADVCKVLDISEQELNDQFLTPNTRHMENFKIRQRALHVIQESLRVLKFKQTCEQALNGNAGDNTVQQQKRILGELMRQSHHSLKELYECSHPELDRLVALSDQMGVPARITGAGWGGCIVALCDSLEASEEYIRTLKQKYFSLLPAHVLERHQPDNFKDVVFATVPGSGAEIFNP